MSKALPKLRMLHNNIMFQFEDEMATLVDKKIQQRGFKEITKSGIIIVSPTTSADKARWGIVTHLGPDVTDEIKIGSRILIEKLMWTNAVTFEEQEYWMTNEEKVYCVEDPAK